MFEPLVEIDPPITPAQRHYLAAFDAFLRSGRDEDRMQMRLRLERVLDQAPGIPSSSEADAA